MTRPSKTFAQDATAGAPNAADARHPRHQHPAVRPSGTHGAPAKLLDAWERKVFTLVARDALIAEFRDVAGRPFFRRRLRAGAAELLAAGIRDFSLFWRNLPSGPIAPDPKDSFLLALAEASEAEFPVTGDKELLSLKHHKSSRIITPAAMLALLVDAERPQ